MPAQAETGKHYKKPSQAWLKARIDGAARRFNQDLTPYTAQSYAESWGALAEVYGEMRLDTAIQRCVSECQFFPTVDDIKQRVPAEHFEPTRCPLCRDMEGWVYLPNSCRVKRCTHAEVI